MSATGVWRDARLRDSDPAVVASVVGRWVMGGVEPSRVHREYGEVGAKSCSSFQGGVWSHPGVESREARERVGVER